MNATTSHTQDSQLRNLHHRLRVPNSCIRISGRRGDARFRFPVALFLIAALGTSLLLAGCQSTDSYYLVGNRDQKKELTTLFGLLDKTKKPGEDRVFLIEQISNILSRAGYEDRMNLFLTTYAERNPHDAYNAYYLLMVAQSYKGMNALPLAMHYYERIVRNYPDVIVKGNSIQFIALRELAKITRDPSLRLGYYKELISRFSDKIDLGSTYYYLARTYEELGQWDQAFQAYKQFLKYPDTRIAGFPDARKVITAKVAFYDSSKDWTMPTLDSLVATIEDAIRRASPSRLLHYKAKVNFFAMSWDQQSSDYDNQADFPIEAFLSPNVRVTGPVEVASDGTEAYLRTTGWSLRIPTWYLYFRKINFPADPEINGRWEWAGIYFGERV